MSKVILTLASLILLAGCNTMRVQNQSNFDSKNIKDICIINNRNIPILGLEDELVNTFNIYNINSTLVKNVENMSECLNIVEYSARGSWDGNVELTDMKIFLKQNGKEVSRAVYHLRAGGVLFPISASSSAKIVNDLVKQLLKK